MRQNFCFRHFHENSNSQVIESSIIHPINFRLSAHRADERKKKVQRQQRYRADV